MAGLAHQASDLREMRRELLEGLRPYLYGIGGAILLTAVVAIFATVRSVRDA